MKKQPVTPEESWFWEFSAFLIWIPTLSFTHFVFFERFRNKELRFIFDAFDGEVLMGFCIRGGGEWGDVDMNMKYEFKKTSNFL